MFLLFCCLLGITILSVAYARGGGFFNWKSHSISLPIRGDLVELTVILRLLKFVGSLIKNDAVLRVCKSASSIFRASQTAGFLRFEEAPRPDARRAWRVFSKKKKTRLRCSKYDELLIFIHVSMYLAGANWGHNIKIK